MYFQDVFCKQSPFGKRGQDLQVGVAAVSVASQPEGDPKLFLWQKQIHKISQERELEKQTTPTTRNSFLRRQS